MIRRHFWLCLIVVSSSANAQISQAEYAARREALAKDIKDGIVVVMGATESEYIPFRQDIDLRYLTGIREPDAALRPKHDIHIGMQDGRQTLARASPFGRLRKFAKC